MNWSTASRAIQTLAEEVRLGDRIEPAIAEEQRRVLLNRTRVTGGIALVVVPFTILAYLGAVRPALFGTGALLAGAAVAAILAINWGIRRGVFDRLYHFPMFLLLGVVCNATACVMLRLTGGGESSRFFFPYFLIFFALGTLFPGRLVWIALTSISLVLGYGTSGIAGPVGVSYETLSSNLILLVDYAFIACIGNRVITALFVRERRSRLELEQANARLREIDRIKTDFFANISHELRTPLTLVLAPLSSLLRGDRGALAPSQAELVDTAQRSASRLLGLINDLLLLSRLDAGKVERRRDLVDVVQLCERIANSMRSHVEELGLHLELEPAAERYLWIGDGSHLERVLLNLLSNACKFSHEGGVVRFGVATVGDRFELFVRDEGIGIPVGDLERIFDRFEQVESASNRRFQGTGIGLSIVKELVELYEGDVWVESELGKGTTFRVRLERYEPAEDERAPSDSLPEEVRESQAHLRPELAAGAPIRRDRARTPEPHGPKDAPTVLVVEDNLELLDYLEQELASSFRVLAVGDSPEALELALASPPDLVLSDIMMPVLDGLELARRLRADERTREVPIILLSARGDLDTKLTGFFHGVDDFVQKPFQMPELVARIELHLRVRAQAKALAARAAELAALNDRLEATMQQLRNAEVRVVQHEKMAALGTVVAGVAHEINNPLHFVSGNVAILRRYTERCRAAAQASGGEATLPKLDVDGVFTDLDASLERMANVTRHLYMFARKDGGKAEEVDLEALTNTVIKVLGTQVKTGVTIQRSFEGPKVVQVCPQSLFQVLMNLIENAIHAVGDQGEIVVECRPRGRGVALSVRDTGPGIPEEALPRIFEPFFTTKPAGKGTGLGLSIVQRLVEQEGGTVRVESVPGRGSTFTVELPLDSGRCSSPGRGPTSAAA